MSTHMTAKRLSRQADLRACERLMFKHLCRPGADRLNEVVRYHLESGGSRLRANLALEAGQALKLTTEINVALAAICELIHNASLLHDDIQDQSTHRRGQLAAWYRFDANTAMCAGTLMLSAAFDLAARIDPHGVKLATHLYQRTADLIVGQTADLQYQSNDFGVEQYLQMAAGKSGALMALPLELVMIASEQWHALTNAKRAGESFAVAYQIADDIVDATEDLSSGNCNIIGVILARVECPPALTNEALHQASQVAQTHLDLAVKYARELPDNSGLALIDLCATLSLPVCTESITSSEET